MPGAAVLAGLLVLFGVGLALIGRRQRVRALGVRRTKDLREPGDRAPAARSLDAGAGAPERGGRRSRISSPRWRCRTSPPWRRSSSARGGPHRPDPPAARPARGPRRPRADARRCRSCATRRRSTIEQKTGALEQLGPIAHEPARASGWRSPSTTRIAQVGLARDDEAQARARVEQNAVDAEEVAGHAERAAIWAEQLAALQRRARVYDATLKALDTAERATIRTATRYLEKTMVVDLERVTAGRYRRVKVDDENLGLRVFAPERGDWVDVATLSQGTLDTVYLAARIGLVRLVTGDRRPPLVLDDPFVTLDDERARRALELLHDISADFQVIYLTTSDRYDAAADAVQVLRGPPDGRRRPSLEPERLEAARPSG